MPKALCTIFQALGAKQYRESGQYLKRDSALIYRWMNGETRKFNRHGNTEALEFYNVNSLFGELKQDGLANGDPMLMVDNIIDGLYIAVIVPRCEKR